MDIIGLCGTMGSGKDLIAALLSMRGYRVVAMADVLRHEVAMAIIHNEAPVATGIPWDSWLELKQDAGAIRRKPTAPYARVILQWWGTEYRRHQDPDYWVKRMEEMIVASPDGRFVIPDIRFENEAAMVRSHGGQVWRVKREGVKSNNGIPGHVSEQLDSIQCDRTIENDCDLRTLAQRVGDLVPFVPLEFSRLMEANNREVEKRRALEAQLENIKAGGATIVCESMRTRLRVWNPQTQSWWETSLQDTKPGVNAQRAP